METLILYLKQSSFNKSFSQTGNAIYVDGTQIAGKKLNVKKLYKSGPMIK